MVEFHNSLRVVLVPSRGEYKKAGLNPTLWWGPDDYFGFQQSANSELMLLSRFENIDIKTARSRLYQPRDGDDASSELFHNACSSPNSQSGYFWSDDGDEDADIQESNDLGGESEDGDYFIQRSQPKIARPIKHQNSLDCLASSLKRSASGFQLNMQRSNSCQDNLSLCVPIGESGSISFENKRSSSSSRCRDKTWPEGSFASMLIAITSAVLLAVVVLTDTSK